MKSSTIHGADFDKIKENIKFLHDTRRIYEIKILSFYMIHLQEEFVKCYTGLSISKVKSYQLPRISIVLCLPVIKPFT